MVASAHRRVLSRSEPPRRRHFDRGTRELGNINLRAREAERVQGKEMGADSRTDRPRREGDPRPFHGFEARDFKLPLRMDDLDGHRAPRLAQKKSGP